MALLNSATFTGLDITGIRPGARPQMGEQLKTIAKDQARAWEGITDEAVPNATQAATAHVHDGTDGVVIPIPLATSYIGGPLKTTAAATASQTKSAYHYLCFFVPAGISTVRAYALCNKKEEAIFEQYAFECYDESSAWQAHEVAVGAIDYGLVNGSSGVVEIYADVTVTPGEVNWIKFLAYEGNVPQKEVLSVGVKPVVENPYNPQPFSPVYDSDTLTARPLQTQHDSVYIFTSFDDGMFDSDDAISSYVLSHMAMNDAAIFEKLTGVGATGFSGGFFEGHTHDGDTGNISAADRFGKLMPANLASWGYGARREWLDTGSLTDDMVDPTSIASWIGNVEAVGPTSTTSKTEMANHPFRLPTVKQSADTQGGTSKLYAGVLVYHDHTKVATGTIYAQVGDNDHTAVGTEGSSGLAASSGFKVKTIQLDNHGTSASANGEELTVKFSIQPDASSGDKAISLLSTCVYLDA